MNYLLVLAAISAVAAAFSAFAAFLSVKQSQKVHEASMAFKHREAYSTEEMKSAIYTLINCVKQKGNEYVVWWDQNRLNGDAEADKVTVALRAIKGYFEGPAQLYLDKLLSRAALRTMTKRDSLNVYLKYGIPLEMSRNPNYDLRPARCLRRHVLRFTPSKGHVYDLELAKVEPPRWK